MAAFLVTGLLAALGLRVFLHGRRIDALPDRAVGLFFVCLGAGALPALGPDRLAIPAEFHSAASAAGHAILSVGFAFMALFVWQCFGPDSGRRRGVATLFIAMLAVLWGAHGAFDHFGNGPVIRLTSIVRGAILAWAFCETFAYRTRLRKQMAIGLGDPVVVNRFTLWSLWTASLLLISVVMITARWVYRDLASAPAWVEPAVAMALIVLASVAAISLGLAFFPPRWYAERLRGTSGI